MAVGPAVGFDGLLRAAPPLFSVVTLPGALVSDEEKRAGAPASDSPEQAVHRWENGVSIEPEGCNVDYDLDTATTDYPYWWSCIEGSGRSPVDANVNGSGTKEIGASPDALRFVPYQIHVGYACSAPDAGPRQTALEARVLRRLEACGPGAVEHELWTGEVAAEAGFPNPYLTDPANVDVLSAAGFGFVTALAEMEDALAECSCGGPHVIHAEPRVVTTWASRQLVERDITGAGIPFLRTVLGTYVVPGTGYPGTGPEIGGGTGEGSYSTSYIYGTGMVRVFLGTPVTGFQPSGALTRTNNDYIIRAERSAVAVFDRCCLIGTNVRLCDEYCAAGS